MTASQWLRIGAGLCLGLAGGIALAQTPADNFKKILPAITFILFADETIQLTISSPTDGASTISASINVAGTVTGPTGLTVSANGVPGVITGVNYTVASVPLVMGVNTITVTASHSSQSPVTKSVTVNRTAQVYNIFTDHLNTPRLVTNQVGQPVWRWDSTDPFGGNPPDQNPSGLGTFVYDFRFPGQVWNNETQTAYNYFRDCYDPATGRYCQFDPIGLRGGINGYAYALNNPLSNWDLLGLETAVIVGEPTSGNPFGHVALAFSGQGVYSFGTLTPLGSSLVEYLSQQSAYRDSTVYILNTTPVQEVAMVNYLKGLGPLPPWWANPYDTCAARSQIALELAGMGNPLRKRLAQVPGVPAGVIPLLPEDLAATAKAYSTNVPTILVPGGGGVSSSLYSFSPRR